MSDTKSLSSETLCMLTGKLLGDGCITKQEGRKPRFQFIHTVHDKEWCFYCYKKLINEIPFTQPIYKKVQDKRTTKGFTECYQVQSRTNIHITWLESIWYCNRKKVIPFSFLEQFLNEQALAWWYQDDGHLNKKGNIPKKIILSTDNFTTKENYLLINLLEKNFSIYFKLDSQNRLIIYDQMQIFYFLRLVEPYMHPSMNRKSIQSSPQQRTTARTTIYLPSNINLAKPTAQINEQLKTLNWLIKIVKDRTKYIKFYKEILRQHHRSMDVKSYQVVIQEKYFRNLQFVKEQTGLTFGQIIFLCFQLNRE